MDPAGLLISIATIAVILDDLSESYHEASATLSLIQAQIRILQAGTQRIQEWLHFTDPTTKAHVMASLGDAIVTVNDALSRLQEDVEVITTTGPKTAKFLGRAGSDQWARTKFAYNEGRLRKHLTDVRECASLVHFTLNVCQLPVGQGAERELDELSMGARNLQRAQTVSRRDRRAVMKYAEPEKHSDDYNSFMDSILAAEDDLPNESPVPGRQASVEATRFPQIAERRPHDRAELHFPEAEVEAGQPERPMNGSRHVRGFSDLTIPESEHRFSRESLNVEPQARPALQSSNSELIDEITTILERTTDGLQDDDDDDEALPPNILLKNPKREDPISSNNGGQRTFSQPQIRRKPVSRSGSGDMLAKSPSMESPYRPTNGTSTTNSRTTSAASLTEKITPLAESLRSLSAEDYITVELDRPQVQPYADTPPAYVAASPSEPRVQQARRRRTTGGSPSVRVGSNSVTQLARENRLDEISTALKDGYNVNETDPLTAITPLMEAARFHRIEACRLLLRSGARLHLKDIAGNTVVHHAAHEGDAGICQVLIDAGAHVADCNQDGVQPLQLAVAGGHTETVLCLVNAVPFKKVNDEALVSAFLQSVKLGDTPTAQALLSKGVKVKKVKESWRLTAYAAQSGSLPMLELILSNKASLKDRSPQGYAPLHYAALHGHQPMVEKLLSLKVPWKAQTKKANETALHMAAAAGFTGTALALASHRDANVTVEDADNQEAIHHSVRKGDVRLTGKLIEGGAKLKNANKFGWKPIHLAAAYGHVALLAECITRGISIEEKLLTPSFKPEKKTNQAARRGYWAEIRWPHAGSRPLHLALEFSHDDVAGMLISGGAKLDETDSRGWRPLHMAAWSCRPDMVELLLAKGVTADARTVDGHTPLSLGFRGYGMTGDAVARRRIYDMLSLSMARAKKSMFKQFTGFMSSGPSDSKTATQRNLAWHRAQLAESLYQPGIDDEGESDDMSISVEGSDIGVALSDEPASTRESLYDGPAGSSQVAIAK